MVSINTFDLIAHLGNLVPHPTLVQLTYEKSRRIRNTRILIKDICVVNDTNGGMKNNTLSGIRNSSARIHQQTAMRGIGVP